MPEEVVVDPAAPVKVDHVLPEDKYTPPDIKMAEALPQDLRDKPFFKDKSFVDVVKEHANLQALLGQRPAVGAPKDDASAEEWDKFFASLRPKPAEDYALPETDFSKAKGRSDEYVKSAKQILFDAGVNPRQATKILTGFEAFLAQSTSAQEGKSADVAKARDAEFEKLLDTTYGTQKQAVIDRTKKLMTESVDPAQKNSVAKVLENISNDTLFALTAVLDGVYKKHIAEDKLPGGTDNSSADIISLQAEAEKIMSSDTYKDFRRAGHEESKLKVREIFQRIADAKK